MYVYTYLCIYIVTGPQLPSYTHMISRYRKNVGPDYRQF